MSNDAVTAEMFAEPAVARMIICHYMRIGCYVFADYVLESLASYHFLVKRPHLSAAFHKRDNGSLIALVLAESTRPVFLLAADVSLPRFELYIFNRQIPMRV